MIRRFSKQAPTAKSASAMLPSSAVQASLRPFHTVGQVLMSLTMMGICTACGASWANNFMNVKKFGRWRFRNQIDDPAVVVDYRHARYFGGLLGALFYWFWVGERKYWFSDYGLIPGNKKFGPF